MPDPRDASSPGTENNAGADFARQADGDPSPTTDDSVRQPAASAPAASAPADPATSSTDGPEPGRGRDDGSKNAIPNVR